MSEHDEQAALFAWAKLASNERPELASMFAIPNGGARTAKTGARLKAEGVKAGVPDLFLPAPRGTKAGLFIELKTAKGRTSATQYDWLIRLKHLGYATAVCIGWERAKNVIEEYLDTPNRN